MTQPTSDEELRELFEKPKRDAVALFKDNHDNGDTAIYQFISDIIPLLKARDAAVRIDELSMLGRLPLNNNQLEKVVHRIDMLKKEFRTSDLGRPKKAHTQADIEGHGDDLWPEQTS